MAVTVFTIGMKALAAFKYGKDLLSCHHEEVVLSHPPDIHYGHDFSSGGIEYASYPGPPAGSYGPPKTPHSESFYDKYGRSDSEDLEEEMGGVMKRLMKRWDFCYFANMIK